jgi:hypothetical protein
MNDWFRRGEISTPTLVGMIRTLPAADQPLGSSDRNYPGLTNAAGIRMPADLS